MCVCVEYVERREGGGGRESENQPGKIHVNNCHPHYLPDSNATLLPG